MAKLKLSLDEEGLGLVEINGADVSDVVRQVTFNSVAGEGMEVVIRLLPIAVEAELEVSDDVEYTQG